MNAVYYIKKQPSFFSRKNWKKLNHKKYLRFLQTPEGQVRKLNMVRLRPCEPGDCCIILECENAEKAKEIQRETQQSLYRERECRKLGYSLFPYSTLVTDDDEISGEEALADETSCVEEEALHKLEIAELHAALAQLSPEEMDLIQHLYLDDKPMSLTEYASAMGIPLSSLSYRRKQLLAKLREKLSARETFEFIAKRYNGQ